MNDPTFGVKMPQELKEQLDKLMKDSGLIGKDFMQGIVNMYQVEKTKEQLPAVTQDLKELQGLTQRINNIYLSLGYRIDNITKAQQEESRQELIKKDSVISDLQSKSEDLEMEKDLINESLNELINQKEELNIRVKELTDRYNDNKSLFDEYKSKNDMVTGLLSKYEKLPDQLEAAKEVLSDSQAKIIELTNILAGKDSQITRISEDWEALTKSQESRLSELLNKHAEDLDRIKDKADVEKDKALLAKDKEDQAIINKIYQENNAHTEKISKLMEDSQFKLNEKISKLMEDNQAKTIELAAKDAKLEKLISDANAIKPTPKTKNVKLT